MTPAKGFHVVWELPFSVDEFVSTALEVIRRRGRVVHFVGWIGVMGLTADYNLSLDIFFASILEVHA